MIYTCRKCQPNFEVCLDCYSGVPKPKPKKRARPPPPPPPRAKAPMRSMSAPRASPTPTPTPKPSARTPSKKPLPSGAPASGAAPQAPGRPSESQTLERTRPTAVQREAVKSPKYLDAGWVR